MTIRGVVRYHGNWVWSHLVADLTDVDGVVVTFTVGVLVHVVRVLPRLGSKVTETGVKTGQSELGLGHP